MKLNLKFRKDVSIVHSLEVGYVCNCFFNDLICQLFFLPYVQIFLIWAEREIKSYIGFLTVGMTAGLIWEFFAPLINAKAVTDIYDLICYLIGVHIYYAIVTIEKDYIKKKKNYELRKEM